MNKSKCLFCQHYDAKGLSSVVMTNPLFNLFFDDGIIYREEVEGKERLFELNTSIMGFCRKANKEEPIITYWNAKACDDFEERKEEPIEIEGVKAIHEQEREGREIASREAKRGLFSRIWRSVRRFFKDCWAYFYGDHSGKKAKNNNS